MTWETIVLIVFIFPSPSRIILQYICTFLLNFIWQAVIWMVWYRLLCYFTVGIAWYFISKLKLFTEISFNQHILSHYTWWHLKDRSRQLQEIGKSLLVFFFIYISSFRLKIKQTSLLITLYCTMLMWFYTDPISFCLSKIHI